MKPNLGHPNMLPKLEALNLAELKRQANNERAINEFIAELKKTLQKQADNYVNELSKSNEQLLIRFDDILTVDDVTKNGKGFCTCLSYIFLGYTRIHQKRKLLILFLKQYIFKKQCSNK